MFFVLHFYCISALFQLTETFFIISVLGENNNTASQYNILDLSGVYKHTYTHFYKHKI